MTDIEKFEEKQKSSELIFDGKVLHLYRDEIYNPANAFSRGKADLYIAKNRAGKRGVNIRFLFNATKVQFIEEVKC